MLNNILEEEDDCFVFFYADNDPEAYAILAELEGNFFLPFWELLYEGRYLNRD